MTDTPQVYIKADLLQKTGLTYPTIAKYEKYDLIPFKRQHGAYTKIYFQDAVDRIMLIRYMIENFGFSAKAIAFIFKLIEVLGADEDIIKKVGDSLFSKQEQEQSARSMKNRGIKPKP